MKKEGWILIVLIGLFIGTMFGMNVPFSYLGYTTGNTTLGNVNNAPVCLTISNLSWMVNIQKTLNLSEYCSDSEGRSLVYNATAVSEITITIVNGVVTFVPATDFTGTRVVTFSAFDYVNRVYTNNVTISVNSSVTEEAVSTGGAARVVAEAEGEEEIILFLAPTIKYEEVKEYYLNDFFIGDTALLEDIEIGSMIYFGSSGEEDLAYAQIALIENEKVLINFVDLNEKLLQLEFFQGSWFELDEDGDGFNDYVIYADYVGNEVVDLRFVKVPKVSFEVYSFVLEYWFIIVILMVILILLILLLKEKV